MDYSLPPASSTLTLAVPPVPLPQARAHEAPGAAAVSLAELEGLMGEAAAEQEGELAELGQWFHGLPPAEKRAALASVAKSLSFQDAAAASTAPATLHLPAAGPSLTIYADAALSTPAAEASAPVAAAPARRPLGDRTNTQAPVNMKQLSSKLHVVASRKQVPQAGAGWLGQLGAGWAVRGSSLSLRRHALLALLTGMAVPLHIPYSPAAAGGGGQGAAGLPAVGGGTLQGGHACTLVPRGRRQAGGVGARGELGAMSERAEQMRPCMLLNAVLQRRGAAHAHSLFPSTVQGTTAGTGAFLR